MTTSDFAAECAEAFRNLCLTRAQIDPNQPSQRLQNQATRRRLQERLDEVLDAYLSWLEVAPFEAEMAAPSAANTDAAATPEADS